MIKTYNQAVKYIKSFIPFTLYQTEAFKKEELKDPLGRMRYLLQLLDDPERRFKSVLIGGTSGKGSTSYLLSHILTTAGYKTGLTQSPHLVRINERIQINGKEISDADFVKLIQTIQPAVETMKASEYGVPSYFEITIAIAFLYFAKQKVDLAVVEVGMGGEYDATNTLEPLIAILTNVSLDHTQFLGDTVEKIARTKIGIIKPFSRHSGLDPESRSNLVVITGVTQPSVIKIVEEKCKAVGAKLFRLGKDFPYFPNIPNHPNLPNLPGDYQKENASLALEAIKQLKQFDFSVSDDQLRKALQTAHFPGRFEQIKWQMANGKWQMVIMDGAHNPAKMHAFVTSLEKAYPKQRKIFVIAFKKDKNIEDMLKEILPVADAIVVTEFSIGTDTMISNAAMPAEEIIKLVQQCNNEIMKQSNNVYLEKDSTKAVRKAMSLVRHPALDAGPSGFQIKSGMAKKDDTIIAVTGSLYLIGELKQKKIYSL